MKPICLASLGLFLVATGVAFATQETAGVLVLCNSLELLPSQAQFVSGVGNETAYFSTFNGTYGSFLVDTANNSISGELRPRSGVPGLFEGGYETSTPSAVISYGSYTANVPTLDTSGIGIPDILNFQQSGTFSATGSGYDVVGRSPFSISFSFSRTPNSSSGTYSSTIDELGTSGSVTGSFELIDYQGSVTYSRGSTNTLTFNLTSTFTPSTTSAGTTTYTVVNSNQVTYAAFTAQGPNGYSISVLSGTLTRSGKEYTGTLQVVNGDPQLNFSAFTTYRIEITDNNNTSGDGIPDFSDPSALPPTISSQPTSETLAQGSTATFSITATGAQSYQWSVNGVPITGATSSTLSLGNVQIANAGVYSVAVTNPAGTISSNSVSLTVNAAPSFTLNPASQTVATGYPVAFNAIASGSPTPTYQWSLNGAPITGAADPVLLVSATTLASVGTYTCMASNSFGSVTSTSATLTLTTTSNPGYLVNLSSRADVGKGNNILIGGFGVTGTGTKQLLVRGVGPGLFNTFGLTGELVTPQLVLLDNSSAIVGTEIGWANSPAPGSSTASESPVKAPASIMATVGAFSYTAGSADTSMVLTMPSGNNTAQVSGIGATSGIALCEIYDVDATPTAHLINISARADVGTGNNILIGGFAIGGSTAETVLIRAVGPGLTDVFGLTGTLAQPVLTLLNNSSAVIYTNTVWGGDATIASVFTPVGAFGLNPAHADSVLLVTLPPGNYTAQVSGLNSGTGIALCEIYEVPSSQALLTDAFGGNAVDTTKWQALLPFSGSSVVEGGGWATFTQRGGLLSNTSFPSSISVTGSVSFSTSTEHFEIFLRTNGSIPSGNASGERTGIMFEFALDGGLSIQQANANGTFTLLASNAFTPSTGTTYNFDVTASGNNLTFAVNGVTELTATSSYSTGNQIVFQNREISGSVSKLRNVTVTTIP